MLAGAVIALAIVLIAILVFRVKKAPHPQDKAGEEAMEKRLGVMAGEDDEMAAGVKEKKMALARSLNGTVVCTGLNNLFILTHACSITVGWRCRKGLPPC